MESTAPKKLLLGYWNCRGLGSVLHSLLHFCKVPYEDKVYVEREEWFEQTKPTIALDYPNLPYIIDGDKNITETLAMMHYVVIKGNRRDLLGGSEEKHCKVLEVCSIVNDLRSHIIFLCWTRGDFEKERDEYFGNGRGKAFLAQFNKNLEGKEWIVDTLSIADFWLLEHLDIVAGMNPAFLEPFPNLVGFRERFVTLSEIQEFRKTDKFIKQFFWSGAKPTWNNTQNQ